MNVEPLFLDLSDTLRIHEHQIATYGGSAGIRDLNALESALAMPKAGMEDRYFHEGLPAMAAAYLYHICQNHPFVDGNKRVAAAAAFTFLYLNRCLLKSSQDAYRDLVLATASGKADKGVVIAFMDKHSRKPI